MHGDNGLLLLLIISLGVLLFRYYETLLKEIKEQRHHYHILLSQFELTELEEFQTLQYAAGLFQNTIFCRVERGNQFKKAAF